MLGIKNITEEVAFISFLAELQDFYRKKSLSYQSKFLCEWSDGGGEQIYVSWPTEIKNIMVFVLQFFKLVERMVEVLRDEHDLDLRNSCQLISIGLTILP